VKLIELSGKGKGKVVRTSRLGEMKYAYQILHGKSEGKTLLGRPSNLFLWDLATYFERNRFPEYEM